MNKNPTSAKASAGGKPASRTVKYLLYAIGEIILVVIGILIALQINNWNQDCIGHKETKVLLSNLCLDIEENIKNLKDQQDLLKVRKDWA